MSERTDQLVFASVGIVLGIVAGMIIGAKQVIKYESARNPWPSISIPVDAMNGKTDDAKLLAATKIAEAIMENSAAHPLIDLSPRVYTLKSTYGIPAKSTLRGYADPWSAIGYQALDPFSADHRSTLIGDGADANPLLRSSVRTEVRDLTMLPKWAKE